LKYKLNKSKILKADDTWNAVVDLMGEYKFPTENQVANKVYIVFDYYSELESGGHEKLFDWSSWYIDEIGVNNYFRELTSILEDINAHDYSLIEQEYGEKLWNLYKALENDEIAEEDFCNVLEQADNEYLKLGSKLGDLLEVYFMKIFTEIFELVED
jgi:hypothetical protein